MLYKITVLDIQYCVETLAWYSSTEHNFRLTNPDQYRRDELEHTPIRRSERSPVTASSQADFQVAP